MGCEMAGWRVAVIALLVGCGGAETPPAALVDSACIRHAHERIDRGDPVLPPSTPTDGQPAPEIQASNLVEGRRIAGQRAISPDDDTKREIHTQGVTQTSPAFKLCLDKQGVPKSITQLRASCFPRYDQQIVETMRAWRYSPYLKDGAPVEVCTGVTFIYTQR